MKIRKARKEDFDQYYLLRKDALEGHRKLTHERLRVSSKQIRKEFEGIFLDKRRVLFVIEDYDKLQGFIMGTLLKNAYQRSAYLDDIFVAKDSQGKGFGKKLMNEFETWSKLKKVTKIRLGVSINNQNAINLYKKTGYSIKYYEMDKDLY